MACDDLNDTIQVRCMEVDGKEHSDHWAITGLSLAMVYWPNESYVAPPKPEPKKKWAPKPARRHSTSQYLEVVDTANANARVQSTPAEDLHREVGHATSVAAAESVSIRSGSQKALLLVEYAAAEEGLTDEEAARRCGLYTKPSACWWHRASDLRKDGMIEETGQVRKSAASGEDRMVCTITAQGLLAARELAQ